METTSKVPDGTLAMKSSAGACRSVDGQAGVAEALAGPPASMPSEQSTPTTYPGATARAISIVRSPVPQARSATRRPGRSSRPRSSRSLMGVVWAANRSS